MTALINLLPFVLLGMAVWFALRGRARLKGSLQSRRKSSIEHLVPLEAYDVDETGYWKRVGWYWGASTGLMMSAVVMLTNFIPNLQYSPPVTAVIAFVMLLLGGPLFGALMRGQFKSVIAGLLDGDPRLIDPPPAGSFFSHQVICSRIEGGLAIGGILYLGPEELLFIPHKRNPPRQDPLTIQPIGAIEIRLREPYGQNWIQRILIPRPLLRLELSWNNRSAEFYVPRPAETADAIGRILEKLRQVP